MAVLGVHVLERLVVLVHVVQLPVEEVVVDHRVHCAVGAHGGFHEAADLLLQEVYFVAYEFVRHRFLPLLTFLEFVEYHLERAVFLIVSLVARKDDVAQCDVIHQPELPNCFVGQQVLQCVLVCGLLETLLGRFAFEDGCKSERLGKCFGVGRIIHGNEFK
eukprot:CAMPEP_0116895472 /NCGR_PEP_ID=MMETSP0467-20121206/4981_1 /TAXON_ID=283647 /ORGANISM="Mesodinium pulex, Strain SPMC105" /LENGTH=160 /DNA_ID=CAMNT_0004566207 /DNA_START=912 /DNA_END=1394 /DNA_ORIENTATION=-